MKVIKCHNLLLNIAVLLNEIAIEVCKMGGNMGQKLIVNFFRLMVCVSYFKFSFNAMC